MSRKRLTVLALIVALGGLLSLGQGGWILVKAGLAQVLLDHAWQRTRDGQRHVTPWPWADTWPVARLRAPRQGVETIVLAGASGAVMAFGPGHLRTSAAPGEPGNCVLTGHRDTHFAFLRHLEPGDEIRLDTPDGARHRYRVTSCLVVDQRETAVLDPTPSPVLTLITCYPFNALVPGGPLRYVVRAIGVPRPPLALAA
ncbi:MAG: class GN sortase [bacterium]|nr:class GN sortase [bacterium]